MILATLGSAANGPAYATYLPQAAQIPNTCNSIAGSASFPSPSTINFDDLGNAQAVGNHYQASYGLTFANEPTSRVQTYADYDPEPTKSRSAPNIIFHYPDFPNTSINVPMSFTFSSPKSHIGMYVGNGDFGDITATLIAYDSNMNELCRNILNDVPVSPTSFLGIHDSAGRIRTLTLDFGNSPASELIDDLMFAYAPSASNTATATATATHTPTPTKTSQSATLTPTSTPTSSPTATRTPTPTKTSQSTTITPTSTATRTPSPTPTRTSSPTPTSTPTPSSTINDSIWDFLDPNEVVWRSVRNQNDATYSTDLNLTAQAGNVVRDLEVIEMNGEIRYSATWQRNIDNRRWGTLRDRTFVQFSNDLLSYQNDGFILIDQEIYQVGEQLRIAGVWIPNKENLRSANYRNETFAVHSNYFVTFRDSGLLPIDFDVRSSSDGLRYSGVWIENREGLSWEISRDRTLAQFENDQNRLGSTHRIASFTTYWHQGQQYYSAVWIENRNQREWVLIKDLNTKQFNDAWTQYRDEGYRLTHQEVYTSPTGYRYAGIWRQNSIRPQWSLENTIDQQVRSFMRSNFDVPGVSVGIAISNELVYLKGFGFADVFDQKNANSRTIYRMASVSKAIAGTMFMDMVEDGSVFFTDTLRTYTPTIQARHINHELRDLVSHRSGVRHYTCNWPAPCNNDVTAFVTTQFNDATSASQLFINDPLVAQTGITVNYSSHAFTLFGMGLEYATGQNINQIFANTVTNRYGLPTLRPENRAIFDENRATTYSVTFPITLMQGLFGVPTFITTPVNVEVVPDNISWKTLGGGLESNVLDLTRFGMKLLNYEILNQNSLNTLFTPPDALSNFYAIGWDNPSSQPAGGTSLRSRRGSQLGSRAAINVYQNPNIVVVVMSNRDDPPDQILGNRIIAPDLAGNIGTAILNNRLGNFNQLRSQRNVHIPLNNRYQKLANEDADEPNSESGQPMFAATAAELPPPNRPQPVMMTEMMMPEYPLPDTAPQYIQHLSLLIR